MFTFCGVFGSFTMFESFKYGKKIKGPQSKEEKSYLSTNQHFRCISLSKIKLTQGWMGWNRDLNIYNFSIFSFLKFTIFEGQN